MAKRRSRHPPINRGRWAVQRERCQIDAPRPANEMRDAVAIEGIVRHLIEKVRPEESRWLLELEQNWAEIVGADVARHSRPGRCDQSTLVVYIDSAPWLHELTRYGSKQMLANVQKHTGPEKVANIRLTIDPDVGRS